MVLFKVDPYAGGLRYFALVTAGTIPRGLRRLDHLEPVPMLIPMIGSAKCYVHVRLADRCKSAIEDSQRLLDAAFRAIAKRPCDDIDRPELLILDVPALLEFRLQ